MRWWQILVATLIAFASVGSGYEWEQIALPPQEAPAARQAPAIWVVDNDVFMFGGLISTEDSTDSEDNLNDIWRFYASSSQWESQESTGVASRPGKRHGATTWSDGSGNLWLFGGFGVSRRGDSGLLNDLWKYNTTTKEWILIGGSDGASEPDSYGADQVWPGARANAVVWTSNVTETVSGYIVIYGGTTVVGCSHSVWIFHLLQQVWINLPIHDSIESLPGNIKSAATSLFWDYPRHSLYMYGGWSEADSCERNALWRLDSDSIRWSRIYEERIDRFLYSNNETTFVPNWPAPRRGSVSFSTALRTFILGGECISMRSQWCVVDSAANCHFLTEFIHANMSWIPHPNRGAGGPPRVSRPALWFSDSHVWVFGVSNELWRLRIEPLEVVDDSPIAPPVDPLVDTSTFTKIVTVSVVGALFAIGSGIAYGVRRCRAARAAAASTARRADYELHAIQPPHGQSPTIQLESH